MKIKFYICTKCGIKQISIEEKGKCFMCGSDLKEE